MGNVEHVLKARLSCDFKGRLIFVEYYLYGNMEGVHIDVFYINDKYAFLLGISHKFKMRWTFNVGKDFKATDIQEALELIFGDYRPTVWKYNVLQPNVHNVYSNLFYFGPMGIYS